MAGAGRRVFQPGEVLTATQVQNYLQDQAVQVYAGTAARGSALGGSATEGMVSYLTDNDQLQVALGTAIWQDVSLAQSQNYIINGGFDIWQRGTSFTSPSNGSYTADRWAVSTTTVDSVARTATTIPGVEYAFRIKRTNTDMQFIQKIESANARELVDKTVTISFWARSSANVDTIRARFYYANAKDDFSSITFTTETGWFNLTSDFVRYSGTVTLDNANYANGLRLNIQSQNTSGLQQDLIIGGIQLEVGSTATPFRRNAPSIQAELAACQRYYFRLNTSSTVAMIFGFQNSTTSGEGIIPLPVPMRVAPSIAFNNCTWSDDVTFANALSTLNVSTGTDLQAIRFSCSFAAGGAQFRPGQIRGAGTGWVELAAEL